MWRLLMLALCSSLQEGMRPSHCQALCSENENFVDSVNPCNTCENRKECSLPTDGEPGCDCLSGYFRNNEGKCVLEEECENGSINKCRKDEVFLECSCEKTCCNGGRSAECAASCKKGCFCKKGLVRHEDGRCIRLKNCGKNNQGPPPVQCDIPKCDVGCSIDYSTKPCPSCSCPGVLPSPTKCGADEQYYECMPLCQGTCSAYLTKSYLFCKLACRSGCFCREGLYQTEDKRCVPASQCTAPNSPSESPPPVQCSIPKCDDDCSIDYSTKPCPSCSCTSSPPIQCDIPNCDVGCSIDYSTKPCPSCSCPDTPPVQCSIPNCAIGCSIDFSNQPCPKCSCPDTPPVQCSIPMCGVGCSLDYSTKPCPSCSCPGTDTCGVNEEYRGCGSACPTTCANLGKDVMCTMQCVPGCFCAKGLVRDDQGTCIPPEQCPQNSVPPTGNPIEMCDEGEEYLECGSACPLTCENRGKNLPCTLQCVPGCFCKNGMVRNDQGECVEPEKCPKRTCGENEEYTDCGSTCPPTCSNLGKNNLACITLCVPGCFCSQGFIRNDQGECVEPEDCPRSIPTCALPVCQRGCTIDYSTKPCPSCSCPVPPTCPLPKCLAGCILDHSIKPCPKCSCPGTESCPPNEEYSQCASACNTCAIRGRCEIACKPGCDCKKGYYRYLEGKCIPKNECPPIGPTRPHSHCGRDQEFYDCVPRCGRTCAAYKRTPKFYCSTLCRKGCFCRKGLYERKDGKCVPPSQCPAVPPNKNCPKNEVFSKCVIPCNGCDIKGKCNFLVCNEGCDCRKGYYRDSSGRCIPEKQCPKQCPKNEVASNCVVPCNDCQTRGKCNFLVCNKGCDCKKGYYRDFSGRCIPAIQCPIIEPTPAPIECSPDEQYYECIPRCMRTCEAYTRPVKPFCSQLCEPGCFCKEGLYEAEDGSCVPPEQCPAPTTSPEVTPPPHECGFDEQYYECIPGCQQTCFAITSEVKIACKMPCRSGCYCKEGLYKKDDGTCVPPEECYDTPPTATVPAVTPTPTCPKNEEYYQCKPTCKNTCENYQAENNLLCSRICIKGCACKKGLVRRKDGKCVKPEKCTKSAPTKKPTKTPTPTCPKNEEYYQCKPTCKDTCENYQALRPICPRICIKGCSCKKGLVRRSDGKCVKPEKCTKSAPTTKPTKPTNQNCGRDEQYYSCIPTCKNTCENYNVKHALCSRLCRPGCFCKKGLVKRKDGKCVTPKKCRSSAPEPTVPLPTSNPTCLLEKVVGPCRAALTRYFFNSKTGQCEKFKYGGCRGNKNNFKTKEDCQVICGGGSPPVQCSIPNCDVGCSIDYSNKPCPKCSCPDTPPIQCDIPNCDDGCSIDYSTKPCPSCSCPDTPPVQCSIPKCDTDCTIDYSTKPCPSCSCPDTPPVQCSMPMCGTDCNIDYSTKPCPSCSCPGVPSPTNDVCKQPKDYGPCRAIFPRFFYNQETGQCEEFTFGGCKGNKNNFKTKKDCETACETGTKPSPPKCGKDEEYYTCVPNCRNTCDTYDTEMICPDYCISGCYCKKGMVKNRQGKCVKTSKCPPKNPPVTAAPLPTNSDCLQLPEAGPCFARFKRFYYNLQTGRCEGFTYGGCGGNKNNFKTKKACERTCESASTPAPQKCGEDEQYYGCVPNCHNTCDTYDQKGPCPLYCKSGCFCKEGMVKNNAGKCVKTSQCPSKNPPTSGPPPPSNPICLQAKEVGPCKARVPRFFYNQETRECEQFDYGGCRGNQNNFETKEECEISCGSGTPTPTCGSDEQYYECTPVCHNTCDTYNKTNIACPAICIPGCFCKEGLVKNDDGTCIPPSQCSPVQPTEGPEECGENEEYYDDCAPSCTGTCQAYNHPGIYHCPRCRAGCWCSQGLVKRSDGQCVPPDQCNSTDVTPTPEVPPDVCPEDEEWLDCGSACPLTCSSFGEDQICTDQCVRGCFCVEGLVRNDQGECVEPEECPEPTCNEDEEFNPCGSSCPPTCSSLGKTQICTKECVPACFCKEPLVRNDEGECVEPEDCPQNDNPECSGENEEVVPCAKPKWCNTCGIRGNCKLKECSSGCDCKSGYYRDDSGVCIPQDQCPGTSPESCGEDEEYKDCGSSCPLTCPNIAKSQVCSVECVQGCFCKEGLVRNDRNECVEPEECPQKSCGEDEEYKDCGSSCPLTCPNIPRSQVCSDQCVQGCFCKEGLVRNDKNECVEPEECPQKSPEECGVDEKYYDCAPSCGGTCDTYNKTAIILCLPCGPGCWCNEGLVKNQEGKCILPEQCELPKGPNKLCGVNEIYYDDCAPSCRGSCDTHDQEDMVCPACTPGCWCKKGYLRNQNGKCVRKRKCNIKRKPCPLNQKYYDCMPDCQNRCNPPDACAAVCKSGCFCKEGLVMREDGKCVRKDLCKDKNNGKPQCGPDQEYYDCYQRCRNSCATRNGVCPAMCESGCFCKKGLFMNDQGKCVEQDECEECSGENEEVVPCAKPKWCNTCGIRGNCKLKECSSGCDCKSGYYRDDSGVCIPQDQCPGTSSGPPKVRCSIPRCGVGCRLDYSTKPCPSCSCAGEDTNTNTGNTPATDNENDSSTGSSYSEEGFSSTQFSESGSMSQTSNARERSSRSQTGSGTWYSTGNEIDSEKDSTDGSEAGYATMSSSATEESSMSSDSENSSSMSSSDSRMWSSSTSSVSENNSEENEIDSTGDSAVSEDISDSESGYSTLSSGSENWSDDMSDDSESSSSKSLSGSRTWSSNSQNDSSGDENESSLFEDNSSSDTVASSGSDDWSSMIEEDSERSSSSSLSGYRMWSSEMSSDFEDYEEEFSYEDDETIYEDNGDESEEYYFSWTEDEDN